MADCQITCITKPHPQSQHEHITHVGNPPTWIWPREQVIASLDAHTNTFYVQDPRTGKRADVGIVHEAGKASLSADARRRVLQRQPARAEPVSGATLTRTSM